MPHNQVVEEDTFSRYKKGLDTFVDSKSANDLRKKHSSAL